MRDDLALSSLDKDNSEFLTLSLYNYCNNTIKRKRIFIHYDIESKNFKYHINKNTDFYPCLSNFLDKDYYIYGIMKHNTIENKTYVKIYISGIDDKKEDRIDIFDCTNIHYSYDPHQVNVLNEIDLHDYNDESTKNFVIEQYNDLDEPYMHSYDN